MLIQRLLISLIGLVSIAVLANILINTKAEAADYPLSEKHKPLVVTSIRPIQLIIEQLFGDYVDVHSVLAGGQSPHHFSLKASHIKLIASADLLVWVGPGLEAPMLSAVKKAKRTLALGSGSVESPDDSHNLHYQHHNHKHDGVPGTDCHIWLSVVQTEEVADRLAVALTDVIVTSGVEKSALDQKLADFKEQMQTLDHELNLIFLPVKDVPFVVYHHGYSRLVARYGLNQAAALKVNPEQQIGAKKLSSMKSELTGVECLFAEKSEVKSAERYQRLLGASVQEVDLLAVAKDYDSYSTYMKQVAGSMVSCLAQK